MQWRDIPFSPPPKTLRWFGIFLTALLGALTWREREETVLALVFGVLAVAALLLALAKPQALRFIYVGWMIVAFPIGWTVSHLLLALLFYGLFTPIGVVFKLIGRDPLCRQKSTVETYWTPKPMPTDVRRYFQQF